MKKLSNYDNLNFMVLFVKETYVLVYVFQ